MNVLAGPADSSPDHDALDAISLARPQQPPGDCCIPPTRQLPPPSSRASGRLTKESND